MPKAYVFNAHGGPEVESFADLPRPAPGPGQLLVIESGPGEGGRIRSAAPGGIDVA